MHANMTDDRKKITSGIASIILIPALSYWLVPPTWFWNSWEFIAALLVAMGCIGEWILESKEDDGDDPVKRRIHKRRMLCIRGVAIGVTLEFVLLSHTIAEAQKQEREIGQLKTSNLVLEKSVMELARQYDLSTNALAEANARLASIRPIKQKFLDWFNRFAPSALQQLKSIPDGQRLHFNLRVGQFEYTQLSMLIMEPGGTDFCGFTGERGSEIISGGEGIIIESSVFINPSLIK
jgi:hypothetical protein